MAYPFGVESSECSLSRVQRLGRPSWWQSRVSKHRFLPGEFPVEPRKAHPKVLLEPLEPRFLLSADLTPFIVDMVGPDGDDFTLRYDQASDNIQIIDDATGEIVDQKLLQETSELRIVGTDQDDQLTVDLANFVLPLDISFEGGLGDDTLVGADTSNAWMIDGTDTGDVNGLSFTGVENLEGGAADDSFYIGAAGNITGEVSGGSGTDTIVAADTANTWEITGADAGTLNTMAFADIENLTGGAGDDIFRFLGGSISGTIEGGDGENTFDFSASAVPATIDLGAATATGAAQFANVDRVIGSSGDDTLIGSDQSNLWNIDGLNSGDVGDVDFEEIENLQGGTADDSFAVALAGQVTGLISGGWGQDSLTGADGANIWNVDGADSGHLNDIDFEDIEYLIGGLGQDAFLFAVGGVLSGSFAGRGGNDRARGGNKSNAWHLSGDNAGDLDGIGFTGIEDLEGGTAADTFELADGATLTGLIGGGDGDDTLFGPPADSTWIINGYGSGSANGVEFDGVENLTGAADNEDTFILHDGGVLSGVIDGNDGGFDSLIIADGDYSTVSYTASNPDSGTIEFDGNFITYSGLEPITDNSNAVDLIFTATAFADAIRLKDGPTAAQLTIESDNGSFESVTFNNPTTSLTVNAGGADDVITLEPLTNYVGALTVQGQADADTLIIEASSAVTLTNANAQFGGKTYLHNTIEEAIVYSPTLSAGTYSSPVIHIAGMPTWVEQGPGPITNSLVLMPASNNPVTGAIASVASHPTDPNVIFIGTVGGGIWKAQNAAIGVDGIDNDGDTLIDANDPDEILKWTSLTDQYPSLSITAITFDPHDASNQTIYAGTGKASSSSIGGIEVGLLKTTNGGNTWTLIKLPEFQGQTVHKIVSTTIEATPGKNIVLVALQASKVGTAAEKGGLYRSVDGGNVFVKVSGNGSDQKSNDGDVAVDEADEQTGLPGGSVTDLWVDPTTNSIVYAAMPGQGLYKSTDTGATWTQINNGLTSIAVSVGTAQAGAATTITLAAAETQQNDAHNGLVITLTGGTGVVGQQFVVTDYDGPTRVATINGTWATTPDATTTYSLTSQSSTAMRTELSVSPAVIASGANAGNHPIYAAFIHSVAGGITSAFAASGTNTIQLTANVATQFEAGDRVFISDTVNGIRGGVNVTGVAQVGNTITLTLASNLPAGLAGGGIAAGAVLQKTGNNFRLSGVFRSADQGATWTAMALPTSTDGGQTYGIHNGGQGDSHFSIVADAVSPNVVYVGGDVQAVSGATNSVGLNNWFGRLFLGNSTQPLANQWTQIVGTNTANNTAPHADSRGMIFDSTNMAILEIDDGGIYKLNNPNSAARAWQSLNASLGLTEFYSVAWVTDPSNPNVALVLGGAQDNGVAIQTTAGGSQWTALDQGDGAIVQAAAGDYYYSVQNLGNFQFNNNGALSLRALSVAGTTNTNIAGNPPFALTAFDGNVQFIQPYVLNSQNSNRILYGTGSNNGGFLYESIDSGSNVTLLNAAIPAGATAPPPAASVGSVNAMAYGGRQPNSPGPGFTSMPDIGYVGTTGSAAGDFLFIRTANQFGAFAPVTSYTAKVGVAVKDVAIDPNDWRNVYVLDTNGGIWFSSTSTGGDANVANWSWSKLNGNLGKLPGASNLQTLMVDTTNGARVILVGGDGGVFRKIGTNFWAEFGTGLPNVLVTDIDYFAKDTNANTVDDVLLIGTLGRGAWTIPNASAHLTTESVVTLTGSDSADVFELSINFESPWLVDFIQHPLAAIQIHPDVSLNLASINDININSKGGADQIVIDSDTGGPVAPSLSIGIDGGADADVLHVIVGDSPAFSAGILDLSPDSGIHLVTDSNAFDEQRNQFVIWDNVETASETTALKYLMDSIGSGLLAVSGSLQNNLPNSLSGTKLGGLNAASLGTGVNGLMVEAPRARDGAFLNTTSVAPGATLQLDNASSLLQRIFEEGLGAFSFSDIAEDGLFSDAAAVRDALDTLDDIAGNVTLDDTTDQDGDTIPDLTFTVQIVKSLDAIIGLDIEAGILDFVGDARITGLLDIEADVEINLVFGLDAHGFFIKPNASTPEVQISNISASGEASGSGRLGFLGVDLVGATLAMDSDVGLNIKLSDPGTHLADGFIRIPELYPDDISDLLDVDVTGDPGDGLVDDMVINATLGVSALLPGVDSGINLANADIELRWNDIETPEGMEIQFSGGPAENLVDFLKFASTTATDTLEQLSDYLTQIAELSELLGVDLPFAEDALTDLLNFVDLFNENIIDPLDNSTSLSGTIPTAQELAVFLAGQLGISLDDIGLSYDNVEKELLYNLDFSTAFSPADFQPENSGINFNFDLEEGLADLSMNANAGFNAALDLSFVFGIDIADIASGASIDDAVFIRSGNLQGSLSFEATSVNATARLGFLGVDVVNGEVRSTSDFTFGLSLTDPETRLPDGRIDLSELATAITSNSFGSLLAAPVLTGSAEAILPLKADFIGVTTATTDTTVTITIADINDLSDIDVLFPAATSFQEFLNFNNMSAAAIASLLGRTSNFLDSLQETRIADLEIPFTGSDVGDLLELQDTFADFLLFEDDGTETDASKQLVNDINIALASAGLAGRIRAESHDGARIIFVAEDLSLEGFKIRVSTTGNDMGGALLLGFGASFDAEVIEVADPEPNELTGLVAKQGNAPVVEATGSGDIATDAALEFSFDGGTTWEEMRLRAADTTANAEIGVAASRLLFENNAATFVTTQEMAARLSAVLGLPLVYTAADETLHFDIAINEALSGVNIPLDFNLDLSPLGEIATDASLFIDGNLGLMLRLGVSLGDAEPSTLLTTTTDLDDVNSGDGVNIKDAQSLFAPNFAPGTTWILSNDAHLDVFINGGTTATPVTIDKSSTLDNVAESDPDNTIPAGMTLEDDLNSQLAALDLVAEIVDSRIFITATGATTSFRIEAGPTDPAVRELGLGTTQESNNLELTLTSTAPADGQLTEDEDDEGKAAEFRVSITIGSDPAEEFAVTLLQKNTADNANHADLVADINDALDRANISNRVYAVLDGSNIKLRAVDAAVTVFGVTAENDDFAVTELDFTTSATAMTAGDKFIAAANELRFSTGRFGSDLTLNVIVESRPYVVTVNGTDDGPDIFSGVDLSTNSSVFDLVVDVNRALRNVDTGSDPKLQVLTSEGLIDETLSLLWVESVGGKLLFNGGPDGPSFSVEGTGMAPAALGLNTGVQSSNGYDLVIETHGGAMDFVNLDGATTIADVIQLIVEATSDGNPGTIDISDPTVVAGLTFDRVQVGLNDARDGLQLTDLTAGGDDFSVMPINGSTAAFDLRIVGFEGLNDLNADGVLDDFDGYGVIVGGQIAGVTLLDRFFVENAKINADLGISLPGGSTASATFAEFISIELTGDGNIDAGIELGLKNPNSGLLGDRVTLTQLIQGLGDPSTIIATPAFAGGGGLNLTVSIDPLTSLIPLDDGPPSLTINVADLGNPFAPSVNSEVLTDLNLGALSFALRVNAPGVAMHDITVNLAAGATDGATTASDLSDLLNAEIQAELDAAFSGDFAPDDVPRLVRADVIMTGGGHRLVLTATETPAPEDESTLELFRVANATGDADSTFGFDINVFGNTDGDGDETNNIANWSPDIDFEFAGIDDLLNFDNLDFSFSAILDALIALSEFLSQFEEFGFLDDDIPLLDFSINDLLDFADQLDQALQEAQADPAGTLQALELKLEEAFGISDPNLLNLTLDNSGTDTVLKVDVNLGTDFNETTSVSIPQFDIPIIGDALDLHGAANLGVTGSIGFDLDFGISLDNPLDVYIYNSTGINGNISASANDLEFMAALGPFGLWVKEGTATINGSVAAGLDIDGNGLYEGGGPTDTRILLGDLLDDLGGNLALDLTGDLDVDLPVSFPTENNAIGNLVVEVDLGDFGDPLFSVSDAIVALPDFTNVNLDLGLFDSILLAVDGVDLFLGGLQDLLDGEIGGFEIPFIGDALSDGVGFVEDLREDFVAPLRALIEEGKDFANDFQDPRFNLVSIFIFDLLGPDGADILKPVDVSLADPDFDITPLSPDGVEDYIALETDGENVIQWNLSLGGTHGAGTEVDFDFGVPGLGIEADGPIGIAFAWDFDFGFGLSLDEGFYIDVEDENELVVALEVSLPDELAGRLGILQLKAENRDLTDDPDDVAGGDTRIGLAFEVDISGSDPSDPTLGMAQFGGISFEAGIAAEAVAEMFLTLGMNNELFGLDPSVAAGIPEVQAEFLFDWGIGDYNFATPEDSTFVDITTVGDAIGDSLRSIEFRHVSLDAGSFLSDVLGPIVTEVKKITDPVQPLIDIVTAPLPVISDLGPTVTLLDLAAAFGEVDPGLIYSIADIITLINRIPDPSEASPLLIDFGNFTVFDSITMPGLDLTNPNLDLGGSNLDGLLTANNQDNLDLDDFLSGVSAAVGDGGDAGSASTINDLVSGESGGGFSFPVFDDPSQIFGLLMGEPATLVAYDMAPLIFEFDWSQFFPIWGPLGVSVNVEFGADIDFDFGYDTLGIQQFIESDFLNPDKLINGFFIGDTVNGVDVNEVELFGSLWAAAELNLGVARAGVGGGITAEINFNLFDPDQDGKVRISELIGNFENQLNAPDDAEKFLAPLAIFDVTGRIFAELFAFLKIDLFVLKVNKKFNITPPLVLVEFDIDFHRPPKLASELDNDDLIIHTGKFAGDRLLGEATDIAETININFLNATTVEVTGGLSLGDDADDPQRFNIGSDGRIIVFAGAGNDVITVTGGTASSFVEVYGEAGIDTIDLSGYAGAALIRGGDDDDIITGGAGGNLIFGDGGMDTITGGSSNDIIFGDSSEVFRNDAGEITSIVGEATLTGTDDIIDGGGGDDILFGEGGDDVITGGVGNDILIGDGGRVTGVNTATRVVTETNDGNGGADTLFGNADNDWIFGGKGDDLIDGGDGLDELFGEHGADIIYGGSADDIIYGGRDDDIIYGERGTEPGFAGDMTDSGVAGGDTIYAGLGNDVVFGNVGDDTIFGEAGDDEIRGNEDNDTIFGQGGDDDLFGNTGTDTIYAGAGDDLVRGGDDPDLIFGGINSDDLDGGPGGDSYFIDFIGGKTDSVTEINDTGADGTDTVTINTTNSSDTVLLRSHFASADDTPSIPDDLSTPDFDESTIEEGVAFVALLNEKTAAEIVNYRTNVESVVLNTLFGDDFVAVDDTRAEFTVNLGLGDDQIQIGQLFRSVRNDVAGLEVDEYVATIETTRGFLTNGVSFDMTVNAGLGNDELTVYHNLANLILNGQAGDDTFLIKAFALAGSEETDRGRMDLTGGGGADTIQYVVNAPVFINGGDGFDTVVIVGTEFGDDFVITENGVFGAGLNVNFVAIEALRVDGAEGDDRFFVKSTNPKVLTELFGGLGSDTFSIAGDTPAVSSNDLRGHSGLVVHSIENTMDLDPDWADLGIEGISANIGDNEESGIVITPFVSEITLAEGGGTASYTVVLTRAPTTDVLVQAFAPKLAPDEEAQGFETIEFVGANAVLDAFGNASSATLSFDATNWYLPQTVTFQAVDDAAAEGLASIAVTHKVSSVTEISGVPSAISTTTLTVTGGTFIVDELAGAIVELIDSGGATQTRLIESNTATVLTLVGDAWDDQPANLAGFTLNIVISGADTITGQPTAVTDTTLTVGSSLFPVAGAGLQGALVKLTAPDGVYQTRSIASNSDTELTLIGDEWQDLPSDLTGYTFEIKLFDGLAIPIVQAEIIDNDAAGVTLLNTGGITLLSEFVSDDTFEVRLARPSADDVTVMLHADPQVQIRMGGGGAWIDELPVTFLAGDTSPKTIDITPVVDGTVEGLHFGYVTADVVSDDDTITMTDGLDVFMAVDPATGAESPSSVDLSRFPVAGSVNVSVPGGLPNGVSFDVFGNTVLFVTPAGKPVKIDGEITVTYDYDIPGYQGQSVSRLTAKIGDNDAPGVLIIQSNQSTDVIEDGDFVTAYGGTIPAGLVDSQPIADSYQVVLTKAPAPGKEVVVRIVPEETPTSLLVTPEIQLTVDNDTLTFDDSNWNVPQTIVVRAIDDDFTDGHDTKVFAPTPHTVNLLQGPLFIQGAGGGGSLTINDPLMLPGETNVKLATGAVEAIDESSVTVNIAEALTAKGVDVLEDLIERSIEIVKTSTGNGVDADFIGQFRLISGFTVLAGDPTKVQLFLNVDWEIEAGDLATVTEYAITRESANFFAVEEEQADWLIVDDTDSVADWTGILQDALVQDYDITLSGLGMGPDTQIGGRNLPGGITYAQLEYVEINLGLGDNIFDVLATSQRADYQTWTVLRTGEGDDIVNIDLNADELPLENGTGATTDDHVLTDADADFGDDGVLAGMTVRVTAGTGSGQSRVIIDNTMTTLTVARIWETNLGATSIYEVIDLKDGRFSVDTGEGDDEVYGAGSMPLIIFGGDGGDTIRGGDGADIIFGDIGRVDYTSEVGELITRLGDAPSPVNSNSALDEFIGGERPEGRDGDFIPFIGTVRPYLGQVDSATVTSLTRAAGADEFPTGDNALTGSRVYINAGTGRGQFRIIASNTTEQLTVTDDWNVIPDSTSQYIVFGTGENQTDGVFRDPTVALSIGPSVGGIDDIDGNGGNDMIFGGTAGDTINGGGGDDTIFGDIGRIDFELVTPSEDVPPIGTEVPSIVDSLQTTHLDIEGDDVIGGSAGDDIVIGGSGDDSLDGGRNDDLIFGDNVTLVLNQGSGDAITQRFRVLTGATIYDPDDDDKVLVDGQHQNRPGGNPAWADYTITLDQTLTASHFGDDYLAGGADDDQIFGQLGDDTIQGDGSIVSKLNGNPVAATRDDTLTGQPNLITVGTLQVVPSFEGVDDGDDYIEGNGGADLIFGNLGQDDIIGGSSTLFSLINVTLRADGADLISGGAGTDIIRNNDGDVDPDGHTSDADVILGDNGNIYRLVSVASSVSTYLSFAYDDDYSGDEQLIVRAPELLDYTPGGILGAPSAGDIGAGDELHGESGDDFLYGQLGDDVLFGEGQDDDLIGGTGNDWISGGTGDDGVLGDDGRIYTSRNGIAEPLYGLSDLAGELDQAISTPGNVQQAIINVTGELKKTVNLTPFSVDPTWDGTADEFDGMAVPRHSDDIIFGGLGSDWLHGGSGDDAISGAEALLNDLSSSGVLLEEGFYGDPVNAGNVLQYDPTTGEFAEYDEFEPLVKIDGFLLNFEHTEGIERQDAEWGMVHDDGDDRIFGDLGNDWLVGGTGRDNLYGGWGDDLLNADDDHSTNGGVNDAPDTHPTYEDRAFGGAGRDRLIANTGGDRLIDWVGEFNSFLVPFAPFGLGTVSRGLQPQIADFLYDLSASDGADPTRAADTGADAARNGEPEGELGVVRQQDFAWQSQTGAPDDPQAGNIPGGPRDVLRSANFNDQSQASGFFADSGNWEISGGQLTVAAESLGGDAVAVYHIEDALPGYFELRASVEFDKGIGGWDGNAYFIFDYQSPEDFKFVGLDDKINKVVVGQRDASGWHVLDQSSIPGGVKPNKTYNMLVAVNGLNISLVVDNKLRLTHTFEPRVIDDYSFGLNYGLVGMGSDNAKGVFDNVAVQVLPPQITLEQTEDFKGSPTLSFNVESGSWSVGGKRYNVADPGSDAAISLVDLGVENLGFNSYLELEASVSTDGRAGFVFDRYEDSFKFVAIDALNDEIVIGHYTTNKGWVDDAIASTEIAAGQDYTLGVTLKGTTVSPTLNGQVLLGYAFNAATVDGKFGLIATGGEASFADVEVKTDDPAFIGEELLAYSSLSEETGVPPLEIGSVQPILDEAVRRLTESFELDREQQAALAGVDVSIADLPGLVLARNYGNAVELDLDAAGHGWFVDPTPGDDSEFDTNGQALPGSSAEGDIDLLTAVTHELGHVLGFDHGTGPIMADTLSTSVRLQPSGESSEDGADTGGEPKTLIFNESLGRLLSVEEASLVQLFGDTDFDGVIDDWDLDGKKDLDFDIPGTKLQRHLPAPSSGLISWSRQSGLTDRLFNYLDT